MHRAPPDPSDPHVVLLEKARHFHALAEEKSAVIERVKAYFVPWRNDKRMKVMGDIIEKEIARVEKEEAEKNRGR